MTAPTMPDGGWTTTDKGWRLHPAEVARNRQATQEALAAIDARNERARTCALCGQRTWALDKFGLCSKTTNEHRAWRAESAAQMAGAR